MHTNIQETINELSLSEKIDMIHGAALFKNGAVERLNIPALVMSDGPCGVRSLLPGILPLLMHPVMFLVKKQEVVAKILFLLPESIFTEPRFADVILNT